MDSEHRTVATTSTTSHFRFQNRELRAEAIVVEIHKSPYWRRMPRVSGT